MERPRLSRGRRIEIAALLLVILTIVAIGYWVRQKQWKEYLADTTTFAVVQANDLSSRSLEELIADLGGDTTAHARAIDGIVGRGSDAVPLLIAALAEGDARTRGNAAIALSRLGPLAEPALPALCSALDSDEKPLVENALVAMQRIGMKTPESLDAVARQLDRPEPTMRLLVIDTLTSAGAASAPALTAALKDADFAVRDHAACQLARVDPESDALLATLKEGFGRNADAAAALESLGARAIPILRELMHDPNWAVRNRAIRSMQALGTDVREVVPDLLALCEDTDWAVRINSMRSLCSIDPDNGLVLTKVLGHLESDPDNNVRRESAKMLGELGDVARSAIPSLRKAMLEDEVHVQFEAGVALWRLTGNLDDGLAGIRAGIKSPGWYRAVPVLREMGAVAVPLVPDLIKLYQKKSSNAERGDLGELIKSLDPEAARRAGIR
jgi:HEAT repeat protein